MKKKENMAIRQQTDMGRLPKRASTQCYARASPIVPIGEKVLEAKLRKAIEQRGGMTVKLTSQLHRGLPDRLVLMPRGKAFFVEVKTTGKRATRLQESVHRELRNLDFDVWVIDTEQKLRDLLDLIDLERLGL